MTSPRWSLAVGSYALARADELYRRIWLLGYVQQSGKDGSGGRVHRRRVHTLRLTLVDAPALFPFWASVRACLPRQQRLSARWYRGCSRAWPKSSSPTHVSPSRCLRLSLWCRACICIARCITCAPSTTVNMLGWFVRAVLIVAFLPVGLGVAQYAHRPSLAPHQLIGAREDRLLCTPMSCGEIGTELLLKGSKQSVFHRNLWGQGGVIGALHLHKLNAYEARRSC